MFEPLLGRADEAFERHPGDALAGWTDVLSSTVNDVTVVPTPTDGQNRTEVLGPVERRAIEATMDTVQSDVGALA